MKKKREPLVLDLEEIQKEIYLTLERFWNLPEVSMETLIERGLVIRGRTSIAKAMGLTEPTVKKYLEEGDLFAWRIKSTWYTTKRLLQLSFRLNQLSQNPHKPSQRPYIKYVILPVPKEMLDKCPVCGYIHKGTKSPIDSIGPSWDWRSL